MEMDRIAGPEVSILEALGTHLKGRAEEGGVSACSLNVTTSLTHRDLGSGLGSGAGGAQDPRGHTIVDKPQTQWLFNSVYVL